MTKNYPYLTHLNAIFGDPDAQFSMAEWASNNDKEVKAEYWAAKAAKKGHISALSIMIQMTGHAILGGLRRREWVELYEKNKGSDARLSRVVSRDDLSWHGLNGDKPIPDEPIQDELSIGERIALFRKQKIAEAIHKKPKLIKT